MKANSHKMSRRVTAVVMVGLSWTGCQHPSLSPDTIFSDPVPIRLHVSEKAISPSPTVEHADSIDPVLVPDSVSVVRLTSFDSADKSVPTQEPGETTPLPEPLPVPPASMSDESLRHLEALALGNNPSLQRMAREASAEWAKAGYVSRLPDPSISSMFILPPMRMEPDRLVAEVQVMQMIPWLGRLHAEGRRAHMEALAAENAYLSERLRVIAELRTQYYRLYVLNKQIEVTEADKAQLESLIKTANARVATGNAQPGDVLLAMLELSSLDEQLLTFRQQVAGAMAEINRLVGRDAATTIPLPTTLDVALPDWTHAGLREIALASQPELQAARLRTAARQWGIEVARLNRRPDLTLGGGWMVMDAPGAGPGAGKDSWTLAVTATIPLWHRKYEAREAEACSQYLAAHASEDEIVAKLDASLRGLWEQAVASQRTIQLYETTVLPQARQTFEADQQSLVNNTVTFDRVVRDYRTLLNLELGYHRALGQLATTLAQIHQILGVDLPPADGF